MSQSKNYRHYHKVGRSNYPCWVSVQVAALCSSLIVFLKYGVFFGLLFCVLSLVSTVILWTSTVVMEGLAGNHTSNIQDGIRFSFGLFLLSELMFFFGIFWCFFDSAMSPSIEIGEVWPPVGVNPISPYGIPLFNTVVLLSSGVASTWAHNSLMMKKNAMPGMLMTLVLAFMFESAQYVEFKNATFSMSDGVFGSIFFFGTGFHGLHVLFGHSFLLYNTFRLHWNHFSRTRHIGLELSLLYWHFVDVVWLFLYITMYWWTY